MAAPCTCVESALIPVNVHRFQTVSYFGAVGGIHRRHFIILTPAAFSRSICSCEELDKSASHFKDKMKFCLSCHRAAFLFVEPKSIRRTSASFSAIAFQVFVLTLHHT